MSGQVKEKILAVGAVGLMIAILVALLSEEKVAKPVSVIASSVPGGAVTVFTDAGTGCQYLVWSRHAVAPRIGRDSKQVCQ